MLFPLVHLALSAAGPVQAIRSSNPLWMLAGLAVLYLFPLFCFRCHQGMAPLREGSGLLSEPEYSPWWTSLQFQAVFNAVPSLEALLRTVPGAYSGWLRLWGSKIGRGVTWTPRIEVSDRSLLEVGDHAILGHRTAFYAHVVDRRQNGDVFVYLRRITIGRDAFIGGGCRFGPGSSVPPGGRLPVLTDLGVNEIWKP